MKQFVKGVAIVTAIFIVMNLTERECFATQKKVESLSLKSVEYTVDGGKAAFSKLENGAYELTFSTKGKDAGYYTVSLFGKQDISLKNKEVIAIKLKAADAVTMNLNALTKEFKTVVCKEGSSVYLKDDKQKTYEMIAVENGLFEVGKGFSGTIYIPVATFGNSKIINSIKRFGMIATQMEEKETSMTVKSISFLTKSELPEESLKYSYQVMGNTSPLIPAAGEHEYVYQVTRFEHENDHVPYTFALSHDVAGVSVSKNGTITFAEGADPEELTLLVTINDSFKFLYRIQPEYSWFMQQNDADAINYVVPNTDEVKSYKSADVGSLDDSIRLFLAAGLFLYLIFYGRKIRKS